ncbi:hypothetical protein F7725_017574 [Dissostichus mawsoni]|uniref:Uncharacterized protein n=1 Tax=Dissostichus mawsoni TaxID=36200 RepID=A0A7J5Z6Q0_DISMA|nr:hypothetical protein F7725_017574 [Dissostichus mawsoni]
MGMTSCRSGYPSRITLLGHSSLWYSILLHPQVKTDLRNQLQGEHLAACLKISINGPCPEAFPYDRAFEYFFRKPRKIGCQDKGANFATNILVVVFQAGFELGT